MLFIINIGPYISYYTYHDKLHGLRWYQITWYVNRAARRHPAILFTVGSYTRKGLSNKILEKKKNGSNEFSQLRTTLEIIDLPFFHIVRTSQYKLHTYTFAAVSLNYTRIQFIYFPVILFTSNRVQQLNKAYLVGTTQYHIFNCYTWSFHIVCNMWKGHSVAPWLMRNAAKQEGRGFDSRRHYGISPLTYFFRLHYTLEFTLPPTEITTSSILLEAKATDM